MGNKIIIHKVRTTRPWGSYTVLEKDKGFKVKIVEVLPHNRLSLQRHKHRSEHWVVVEGQAKITDGTNQWIVNINESLYIPKEGMHRLENDTDKPLKIIEVQCGDYLEEDDIERFDDDYDRG